jgi:phosphoribosyl-AMP cyclohydrolase
LAWANRETLQETLEIGQMVYFSRSRNARWHKGDTSGDFLNLVGLYQDCDADAVLALVNPVGAACHNGTKSCFEES